MIRFSSVVGLILLFVGTVHALISVEQGNRPLTDQNWPSGAVELANLKTRVGCIEGPPFGGGEEQLFFRGDAAALQQAVDLLAKIQAPKVELVLHKESFQSQFLQGNQNVDWKVTFWNAQNWYQLHLNQKIIFNSDSPNFRQPLPPPRMDVYLGSAIEWTKIKVPDAVAMTDLTDGMIRGQVYDMLTSKPIAGADVLAGALKDGDHVQTKTDANGRFEVKDEPGKWFPITISAARYATRVAEGPRPVSYLLPAQSISGQVVDPDGKPLPHVLVRAREIIALNGFGYPQGNRPEYETDGNGHFVVTDLPQGQVQLMLRLDSYYQLDPFEMHPSPGKDLVLHMILTGTVRGKVLDKLGNPVTEGNVDLTPSGDPIGKWSGSTSVNVDGSFEFKNVPPGKYFICGKTVDVQAGKIIDVEVTKP